MRYLSRAFALVVALLLLGVSVGAAQHPQTRKGFWIGFGFGWGSYGISCDSCGGAGREGSYTGYIKLGGTVSPHLLLGAESNAWSKSESGVTLTAGNVTFSAFYYPKPASGFFLNGGVGFSRAEVSGSGASVGNTGPGFTLGAGYDIRVGTNISITPIGNWNYGHPESGFSHNFYQFSVGVTFH
jgi:Outer membrane protein beta-barrel domain